MNHCNLQLPKLAHCAPCCLHFLVCTCWCALWTCKLCKLLMNWRSIQMSKPWGKFFSLEPKNILKFSKLNLHLSINTVALASVHCLHLLVFTMAPLLLLNNFKFKYFFSVQILVENLIPAHFLFLQCTRIQQHKWAKKHSSWPWIALFFTIDL